MNLSFLYSIVVHIIAFLLMLLFFQPAAQKAKAVYTIDFIGTTNSQPARYGKPDEPKPAPKAAQEAPKPAESEIKVAAPKPEPKKPAKPAYNAKEQISQKPKETKKPAPKPEPKKEEPKKEEPKADEKAAEPKEEPKKEEEKVVLAKPSILGESVSTSNLDPSAIHNLSSPSEPGGNAVRASFTNFPYPWYITLVRNALWKEWSKKMPKKSSGLSTLVSFNLDKNGAIYGVQIEQSSGNDSYDYAATSSVNNSAPYPPLPKEYPKDILTVTVEFKNED